MSAPAPAPAGGVGLLGATFLVFLTLKLLGVLDWSWWAVTAPLWVPALLVLLVVLAAGTTAALVTAVGRWCP